MKNRKVVIIPLLIVNTIAVTGQFIFWKGQFGFLPLIGAALFSLGFAVALESISVYVAYHAHLAELSQDSSFRLRFGSYAAGLVIGILNGSHFVRAGHITAASVGMFILSASSPILWAIHTRRESRDDLKAKGLIEDKAVKLGVMRYLLWPNQAFPVFRLAIWRGENNPQRAIADWEESRERTEPVAETQPERITIDAARTKAEAVRAALAELGADLTARAVAEWLAERGWSVSAGHVRAIRAQATRNGGATVIALPGAAPAPEIEPGRERDQR